MSMSIGGIASGLNTSELIDTFMKIEAMPQMFVKHKLSATDNFISALQALNTKVASLADNAKALSKPDAFSKWATTVSSEHATATTSAGASITDLSFRVDQLAQGQSSLTGVISDPQTLVSGGKFSFTTGVGDSLETWELDIAPDASLTEIAAAVNRADSGVRATVVTTADGPRLQMTSTNTGAEAGQFSVISGDGSAQFQDIRTAQDAKITLWAGTPAASEVTSDTNTFAELATGVSVTVSKVHAAGDDDTALTVNKDSEAITKMGSNLVEQVNQMLSEISSRAKVTVNTSGGETSTSGGLFTGDASVRMLASQISDALSYPVDGMSPSTIGIEITRDGEFKFDEEKFAAALAEDPEGTQAFLAELGGRVEAVATAASDRYDGSITQRIQSQQSLSSSYNKQIEEWDRRLELREASLRATYTAMEVALSRMQGTMQQMAGQLNQLAGLNSN